MLRLSAPLGQRLTQAPQFNVTFGGGEANVAVSVANYGFQSEYVTRLPENDNAEAVIRNLRTNNVGTGHIIRGGERVGVYYLEPGAMQRGSKVLYDRANSAISQIKPGMVNWEKVFEGADWFHVTGITPAISQGAADASLEAVAKANEMGVTVSTDLNYRKKLWKYGKQPHEVMEEMVAGCDINFGNAFDTLKFYDDQSYVFQNNISKRLSHYAVWNDYIPTQQEIDIIFENGAIEFSQKISIITLITAVENSITLYYRRVLILSHFSMHRIMMSSTLHQLIDPSKSQVLD